MSSLAARPVAIHDGLVSGGGQSQVLCGGQRRGKGGLKGCTDFDSGLACDSILGVVQTLGVGAKTQAVLSFAYELVSGSVEGCC